MKTIETVLPPHLQFEWILEQNPPLTSELSSSIHRQLHFWRCRHQRSHVWQASIQQRIHDDKCPHCTLSRQATSLSPGSLATLYPDLIQAWHPTANTPLTPHQISPSSHAVILWTCQLHPGHLWRAAITEYLAHAQEGNPCPTCRYGWTIANLRLFVEALLPHLDQLTPPERFLLAQQAGLFDTTGETRALAEALLQDSPSHTALKAFAAGQASAKTTIRQLQQQGLPRDEQGLPRLAPLPSLSAFDVIAPIQDEHAIAFLIESGVQKLWRATFDDHDNTLQSLEHAPTSGYATRIKEQFLEEYHLAKTLALPNDYHFTIDGQPQPPNLMQRLIAVRLRDRRRIGNFCGTGSGKTLAALLASQVINAHTTIILTPNNVIPNWVETIQNAFPHSDIHTKTLTPRWTSPDLPRYLILHYELLQQPNAEQEIQQFLQTSQTIDCLCIDEQHLAKVRRPQDLSLRRQRLNLLATRAFELNSHLHLLAMTATPVINDLEEARSTLELVTGQSLQHLNTAPTVANAMRMHQELIRTGFRWVPQYAMQYREHHLTIDCTAWIPKLLALPKRAGISQLEQLLLQVRLPDLLTLLEPNTIIYTSMIDGIVEPLARAIHNNGWQVGCFTGQDKTGLREFLNNTIDVLIISDVAGVGVDGLQHVCHRLICLTLPWSDSGFKQLVGRLFRQGQSHSHVDVYLLFAIARIKNTEWSYDRSKWERITFKRTLADAVTDGIIPDAPLQSPDQVYRSLMAWLARLNQPDQIPQDLASPGLSPQSTNA